MTKQEANDFVDRFVQKCGDRDPLYCLLAAMDTLETCECCGETIGLSQAIVSEAGQVLCPKCNRT